MKRILLVVTLGLMLLSTGACTNGQEEIASPSEVLRDIIEELEDAVNDLEDTLDSLEQELLDAGEGIEEFVRDIAKKIETWLEHISESVESLTGESGTVEHPGLTKGLRENRIEAEEDKKSWQITTQNKISPNSLRSGPYTNHWCPQRNSNPCRQLERLVS